MSPSVADPPSPAQRDAGTSLRRGAFAIGLAAGALGTLFALIMLWEFSSRGEEDPRPWWAAPDLWPVSLEHPFAPFVVFGCAILAPALTITTRRSVGSRRLRALSYVLSGGAILGAATMCGIYVWALMQLVNDPPQW